MRVLDWLVSWVFRVRPFAFLCLFVCLNVFAVFVKMLCLYSVVSLLRNIDCNFYVSHFLFACLFVCLSFVVVDLCMCVFCFLSLCVWF